MRRRDLAYAAPGSYVLDEREDLIVESFYESQRDHAEHARTMALRLSTELGRPFSVSQVVDLPEHG